MESRVQGREATAVEIGEAVEQQIPARQFLNAGASIYLVGVNKGRQNINRGTRAAAAQQQELAVTDFSTATHTHLL